MLRPRHSRAALAALSLTVALHLGPPANAQCPPHLGSYDTPALAYDVDVSGDVAYVADGSDGLHLIDVSDPTAPALLGTYDTIDAVAVCVAGDVAYLVESYGRLYLIDVSNPAAPALLGFHDTFDDAHGVAVSGSVAYVAGSEALRSIDVTDPMAPAPLGSYDTPDVAHGVAVSGDVAYVAGADSGLLSIDISAPTAPALLGSFNTPGRTQAVAVEGDQVCVGDFFHGLQVFDVSDPATPALLGSYNVPTITAGIALEGDLAYMVGRGPGTLHVFDVSDPTSPALVGSHETTDQGLGVAVAADVAYVADRASGLQLFDVSDGPLIGTPYCDPAVPNSTGSPGILRARGSAVVADDELELTASSLPGPANGHANNIGYFMMGTGTNTFMPPGAAGPLCIAPGLQRYLPPVSRTKDLGSGFERCIGTSFFPDAPILAGETWNFQAWHRDGAGPSNFTNAVSITFR